MILASLYFRFWKLVEFADGMFPTIKSIRFKPWVPELDFKFSETSFGAKSLLGVDSPLFSTIVLFKNQRFPRVLR